MPEATATSSSDKTDILIRTKSPVESDPVEVEMAHLARFHELVEDTEIFEADRDGDGVRRHFHVISGDGDLKNAKIQTPHHFHMSYLDVPPGSRATAHAHDIPEIFIPLCGRFELQYGEDGEHSVVLDPYDCFSVPVDVMRTFINVGQTSGLLMVIYDGAETVMKSVYQRQSQRPLFEKMMGSHGDKFNLKFVPAPE